MSVVVRLEPGILGVPLGVSTNGAGAVRARAKDRASRRAEAGTGHRSLDQAVALERTAVTRASIETRPIAVAPIGDTDAHVIDWLAGDIRTVTGREVIAVDRIALPAHALDPEREQWQAATVLETLAQHKRPDWLRLLGIVDVDLYAPGLNFVFGEAVEHRGVGVFSTARLHPGTSDDHRFHRRASTEAIHELGHTFGLGHCSRPECVMWFSNTLGETDRKQMRPCAQHAREWSDALQPSV